jgi:DNA invertase Pin-like site-specific DNA recombinase
MSSQVKKTALYARLSKDDEKSGESCSIETQKEFLMQYAKENKLLPAEFYIDDGYSGLNFERPDFQRMIDDIVAGKVHIVITKDLSRLGRDHIGVGQYTEIYFPTRNIRYIAVNDGVDTANVHSNDFAALKNVINEFYSRDASRKIRSSIKTRAKAGKYRSCAAPFGYLKDPADHNHLIPDPETAHYVTKIFELVASGWGNYRIRAYLRENKVGCPSWYQFSRGEQDKGHMFPTEESRYFWRPDTLRLLIRNRVYMGDCVSCKTTAVFKANRNQKTDEKDWIIVENTHEPLVSRDLWNIANELVSIKRQESKANMSGYISPFKGLLKCADCGKAMTRRKYGSNSSHQIYVCTTYATYGVGKCSQHKIFEDDLYAAVLSDIQANADKALAERDKLVDSIIKAGINDGLRSQKAQKSTYNSAVKRLSEIEKVLSKLYEDSIIGKITQDNFDSLMGKYQNEQKALKDKVSTYETVESKILDKRTDAEKCVDLLARYSEIKKLTGESLNALISRIEIHECEPVDGTMNQKVNVYYRYAGVIDPCEFNSLTFYQTKHTSKPLKTRTPRKKKAAS